MKRPSESWCATTAIAVMRVLVACAAAALAASVWTMRSVSLDWALTAAAILTPAAVTLATLRRRLTN